MKRSTEYLEGLTYYVPRRGQGQIVEHGYAYGDDEIVRHTYDRSNKTSTFSVQPIDIGDALPDLPNEEPTGDFTDVELGP